MNESKIQPDIEIAGVKAYSRGLLAELFGKKTTTLAVWGSHRIGPQVTHLGNTPVYLQDHVKDWILKSDAGQR